MLNNFLFALLSSGTTEGAEGGNNWSSYIFLGILVVFFIGMMIFSSRSQKKRQKKVQDMIDALKVGDKVKTIGGFIGTIIEVCEDNAFIIETGSTTKKSYMKIDKSAIYASTDTASAKAEDTTKPADKQVYDEVVTEEDNENN